MALSEIGDVESATASLAKSEGDVSTARNMQRLIAERDSITSQMQTLSAEHKSLPDESSAQASIDKCVGLVARAESCASFIRDGSALANELAAMEREMEQNTKDLNQAFEERDEILKSVTICPINLGPVSPECLKGIRTPVVEETK